MEKEKEMSIRSNRVKATQIERGCTNKQMAELLGVTEAVYGQKLRGNNSWTLRDLEKLVLWSKKDFEYFYGRDE